MYSTDNLILDISTLNKTIDKILLKNKLTRSNNNFFNAFHSCSEIDVQTAYTIAVNWKEITKTFLFTVIQGLGVLASQLLKEDKFPEKKLAVLQTAFYVISDDLNNCHPIFKRVAPKNVYGIHYKWWEESILKKLQQFTNQPIKLTTGTKILLDDMHKLACDPLGAAVQLRIVEAIALDIAATFLMMVNAVKFSGNHVFFEDSDKQWILAHVEAETLHNEKVSNNISGMVQIAQTSMEQQHMLHLANEYSSSWNKVLEDLAQLILI